MAPVAPWQEDVLPPEPEEEPLARLQEGAEDGLQIIECPGCLAVWRLHEHEGSKENRGLDCDITRLVCLLCSSNLLTGELGRLDSVWSQESSDEDGSVVDPASSICSGGRLHPPSFAVSSLRPPACVCNANRNAARW